MKELTIEDIHAILLNIAKEFHDICKKHDIPYYMLGGTMLGAVRHKGFIPWDDDMDFGVPRKYFNKLISSLEQELSSDLQVLTMDNSYALINNYIKIEDKRTVIQEKWKANAPIKYGINIDIFPLDMCNGEKRLFSKNSIIQILLKVQAYRFFYAKSRPLLKKILAYIIKSVLFGINKRTIINFIENHLLTNGQFYANHYGAWGYKEIIPKQIFKDGLLYDFEDTQFYGAQDFDNYLKCLYNDYMQLPPENKRRIHFQNKFWK